MVDEIKDVAEETKAVAVKKSVIKEKIDLGKEKLNQAKERCKDVAEKSRLKIVELKAKVKLLEEKCRSQATLLAERVSQSPVTAKAKTGMVKAKAFFDGVQIVPKKKLIFAEPHRTIYGYIDYRNGDSVVMRDACYIEYNGTLIDLASKGEGLKDKVSIYGNPIISDVKIILDVSEEAAMVIERA